MAAYVARQPIFDREGEVFAYELLARAGPRSTLSPCSEDEAVGESAINRHLLLAEIERLTSGRKAFVNVSQGLLLTDWLLTLPPEKTVIEVLETVRPDAVNIDALRRLKDQGFTIALDDFVDCEDLEPFVQLADILKIDFRATAPEERRAVVERNEGRGLVFLAEKVESKEEMEAARASGYALFQGYFFCTPELISSRDLPAFKRAHLDLLRRLVDDRFDAGALEEIIEGDETATRRILAYVNAEREEGAPSVTSLAAGLSELDEDMLKRCAALVALGGLAGDKPTELLLTALVRARFAERLATMARMEQQRLDLYCLGLFSALDAIVGRPLTEVLDELEVPADVHNALVGRPSPLNTLYYLVIAYERANWGVVGDLCLGLDVEESMVPEVYAETLRWADRVFA